MIIEIYFFVAPDSAVGKQDDAITAYDITNLQ